MEQHDPLDALAALIGHATIRWNQLQFWIFVIFVRLLASAHREAHALFFNLRSDSAQRDLTLALARVRLEHAPKLLDALKKFLNKVNQAAGRRNDVLHAMWTYDETTGKIEIAYPSDHRLRDTEIEKRLREIIAEFTQLEDELILLTDEIDVSMAKKGERDARKLILESFEAGFLPQPEPTPSQEAAGPRGIPKGTRRRSKSSQA